MKTKDALLYLLYFWLLKKLNFGKSVREKIEKADHNPYPESVPRLPWNQIVLTIYGLLAKCEVKMARYWSSSFYFRGKFSCETRRVVLSGQDGSISPAQVANHSTGFDSSCLRMELAI